MCPTPKEEARIEELAERLEEALENDDRGRAEELNYELDEMYNMMEARYE